MQRPAGVEQIRCFVLRRVEARYRLSLCPRVQDRRVEEAAAAQLRDVINNRRESSSGHVDICQCPGPDEHRLLLDCSSTCSNHQPADLSPPPQQQQQQQLTKLERSARRRTVCAPRSVVFVFDTVTSRLTENASRQLVRRCRSTGLLSSQLAATRNSVSTRQN